MNFQQVLEAIEETPKGSNVVVQWMRTAKTKKNTSDLIEKRVRMICRIGVNYDNINNVQEKRENGELPQENAGLVWGKWHTFPYIIEHNNKLYIRLYKGTGINVEAETQWFINGQETTLEAIKDCLLASEKKEKDSDFDCFCVPIDCIFRLNKQNEIADMDEVEVEQEKEFANTETEVVPF